LFSQILTIPLLPYRFPTQFLTHISSKVPFAHLPLLAFTPFTTASISGEDKVYLIATLHALTPPRYKILPADALSSYLRLLTLLLNSTPIYALNPSKKHSGTTQNWGSRTAISVSVVSPFAAPAPLPPRIPTPDPRILKRIATLPHPAHIASLLSCKGIHTTTILPALIECLFALNTVWPAVLGAVLATGAALVREVYKVRWSVLRKDAVGAATLLDPQHGGEWPALLFLTDLYEQVLRMMGDDEFLGSSDLDAGSYPCLGVELELGFGVAGTTTQAQRNPLTLDELRVFSQQLLNIAFALYWGRNPSHLIRSSLDYGDCHRRMAHSDNWCDQSLFWGDRPSIPQTISGFTRKFKKGKLYLRYT
jgi:ubiquitin-protein ligase E3 C